MVYHGDLWRANTCYRPLSAGRDVAAGSSTAPWAGLPGLCNTGRDNRLRLEVGDTAECDLSLFRGYDASSGKARGADIRMLYTPLDALSLAEENPDKEIVFFAIGFETTAPVHLMALKEAIRRGLPNFSILTSLFTVPPAIEAILSDPESKVDGFLTAGHVCAITGNRAYHRLAAHYKIPMVVTGFEPVDLLYGIYRCVSQLEAGSYEVENAYKRAVPEQGNAAARQLIDEMLEPCDQDWRGIGIIPSSGLQLRSEYKRYSSRMRFQLCPEENQIASECIAGLIMRGLRQPSDCPHFGKACHPTHPLGAPMVSSEGVCAAYYRYK